VCWWAALVGPLVRQLVGIGEVALAEVRSQVELHQVDRLALQRHARFDPRQLQQPGGQAGEAVELAEIELRRRNVRLSHYVAARLPKLLVDPILIEQVLVNLMKNAAESIDSAQRPTGKRQVELQVGPKVINGHDVVHFSVTDTGKGLPPEVLEHLYEAFFSTKAEGMGIGLNLCRSIVESHQGRITAENLYNAGEVEGCCFSFWIPVSGTPLPDTEKLPGVTE
jgi:signal transduction histidine kinase